MNDSLANVKKTVFYIGQKFLLVAGALALIMIVLAFTGYNPLSVLDGLGRGITSDIGGTLRWTAPLIFCGLAIAIPMRAGVFNMGVDGQLMLGAIATAAVALTLSGKLPVALVFFLALAAGMLVGMIWALIPGIFRVKWGTDEVVTTLLMNFVANLFSDYIVMGPLRGAGSTGTTYSTDTIDKSLWLARLIPQSSSNIGLIIAIFLAILASIIIFRTTFGYEIKLVGTNSIFAQYGGINTKKAIILTMLISGAIAGLAGAVEILGVHHRFPGRFNTGLGFDGVVVSLLANNNPIGIIFSGSLFGLLRNGAMNMERVTDIPRAMVDIVQAIIVLTATAKFVIQRRKRKKEMAPGSSSGKNQDTGAESNQNVLSAVPSVEREK